MPLKAVSTIAVALTALALLSVPGSQQPAIAQDDVIATLTMLVKDHVYPGLTYRKETIRNAQFASLQGMLGLEFDDVGESYPITAIIPLSEIVDVATTRIPQARLLDPSL